jgi:16S rRNA processing protein RimM
MSPAAEVPGNLVVMGQILAPYGVQGWVKVRPHTERPDALLGYATWWVKQARAGQWREMTRIAGRVHADTLVVQIEGVETREAALGLKLADIGVPREALPAARAREIYCVDLVGLSVTNREGAKLGEIVGVVDHGAHPLLQVARPEGGALRLIPYVPSMVDRVDLAARQIDVDWGENW